MGKEKDIIKEHFQGRWQEFYAPFVDGLKKDGRDYTAKCPCACSVVGSSLFLSDRTAAFAVASGQADAENRASATHADRKARTPLCMLPVMR